MKNNHRHVRTFFSNIPEQDFMEFICYFWETLYKHELFADKIEIKLDALP